MMNFELKIIIIAMFIRDLCFFETELKRVEIYFSNKDL